MSCRIMLVEDDRHLGHFLVRRFSGQAQLIVFRTLREAEAALHGEWDGAIIDRGLPDGDGLVLAKHIALQSVRTPVLLFTSADPGSGRAEAGKHGVFYSDKADGFAILDRMMTVWTALAHARRGSADERLARLASACRLSVRECDIVRGRLAGRTREQSSRELGISPATHRSHVHTILHKTGFKRLAQLVASL